MNTSLRRAGLPRGLALGSAVASSVCGLVLVVAGPTVSAPAPRGLVPATVVDHVLRQLPADSRNIHFNGLYGSGHTGAWEFVAHLTWRDGMGRLHGGRVNLPETAGQAPLNSSFGLTRLQQEERIGWKPNTLARILRQLPQGEAPLALVEFVPDAGLRVAPVVHCSGPGAGVAGCTGLHSSGGPLRFSDELVEVPAGRALSVQRVGARVTV